MRELGRIERTQFILSWLQSVELRRRVHAGLNKGEAGIRATGIGCYFDDPVHEVFGISSRDWQSFYHFAVGGPIEDGRLTTLPAYSLGEAA